MTINIYNKEIAGPPKCGSRFLSEIWGNKKILKPGSKLGSSDWIEINNREWVDLFKMIDNPITSEVKWIVIREPNEFMESAIHTEFVGGWNRERETLNEVDTLYRIIMKESQSHWHRELFKSLYLFGLSLPTPPTIVMLDDLTDFLKEEYSVESIRPYKKTKYDFSTEPIWLRKTEMIYYLEKKYPKQWDMLQNLLKTDELFWYKMKNEFPIWKSTINEDTKKFSLKNDLPPNPPSEKSVPKQKDSVDIKIFDGRILAPSKCGTRYLLNCWKGVQWNKSDNVEDITHMVIRNPYEHFKSAIHTEYYNNYKINPTIMNTLVKECLNGGVGHWNPNLYKVLYEVKKLNNDVKIIDLKNLSEFVKEEGFDIPFDETNYDWHEHPNWKNKDEFWDIFKFMYPYEVEFIEKKLAMDYELYEKLIEDNVERY